MPKNQGICPIRRRIDQQLRPQSEKVINRLVNSLWITISAILWAVWISEKQSQYQQYIKSYPQVQQKTALKILYSAANVAVWKLLYTIYRIKSLKKSKYLYFLRKNSQIFLWKCGKNVTLPRFSLKFPLTGHGFFTIIVAVSKSGGFCSRSFSKEVYVDHENDISA